MIPEFYAPACETPEAERVGRVFKFAGPRGGVRDDKTILRTASRIFRRAGVYAVNGEKSRHATLHNLRRTFGKRMAERYPWPVLRLLMRHENLKTTLDFYVGEDVESAKRLIWPESLHHAARQTLSEVPRT